MGAAFNYYVLKSVKDRKELEERFLAIVQDCQWECGHGGYTGTFAEKGGLVVRTGEWDVEGAYNDCLEGNDKWGPAWAYMLSDGGWFVGGWCSE